MKNIGLLGGTFDPVHIGHIEMAKAAYSQIGLEKVVFMPTSNPPHKNNILNNSKRIAMLNLALDSYPEFEISTIEMEREGMIYTADTIEIIKKTHPDINIYYIIGADSFFQIKNWYMPERFLNKVILTVCKRDDSSDEELYAEKEYLHKTYGNEILILDFKCISISSSEIRSNPEKHKNFLSEKVYEYIIKEGLYK